MESERVAGRGNLLSHLQMVATRQHAGLETKERLVALLRAAAELEHALALEYLYAGYTVKRPGVDDLTPEQEVVLQGWRTNLFLIARQEMEHLGMVNNMLNAIGVTPTFERPAFPVAAELMPELLPLRLARLDRDTLHAFLMWERPQSPQAAEAVLTVPRLHAASGLLQAANKRDGSGYTIGTLYMEILDCFTQLTDAGARDDALFDEGRAALQYGLTDPNENLLIQPVTSYEEARSAIFQILEEGEGLPFVREAMPTTHFERYLHMWLQLHEFERHGFDPARTVIENPVTAPASAPGTSYVSNASTRRVAEVADLAYQNMIWALRGFYANPDGSVARNVLGYLAFMPMMTMAIRPLAEILTELPATDDVSGPCAGPPFTPAGPPPTDPAAFWSALRENMEKVARDATELSQAHACTHGPAHASRDEARLCAAYQRLGFVGQNMRLMAKRAALPMSPEAYG